jgi:crossover junction endodeoxyribonuclease RuvC
MRVVGFDPGLRRTGWGIIEAQGSRLSHVANGAVETDQKLDLPKRLVQLHRGIAEVLERWAPEQAAVETSLVNKNAASSLKLGVARGIVLFAPAAAGLAVAEYLPMIVKKSVVGTGHASKQQVQMMVERLLPGCSITSADAADALAVAICHSHHASTGARWAPGGPARRLAAGGTR